MKHKNSLRLLILTLIGMIMYSCQKDDEINRIIFNELQKTYDININFEYSESFFPATWIEPPISVYGIQIKYSEAERMEQIIEDCLQRYSKLFLNTNLKDIYLLKRMYLYDKSFGGTYTQTGIYITNDGYSYEYLLGGLHHEFSSIIYTNYNSLFPFEEWNTINSSEFEYIGAGLDLLGQDDVWNQTEELLTNGFLMKYSTSSMENDFNMLVYWMFTKPNEILALSKNYDKIREKYNLVLHFYDQIDSGVEF